MTLFMTKREGAPATPCGFRLGLAALGTFGANLVLAHAGVSLVQRLVVLVAFVLLAVASLEAFLERRDETRRRESIPAPREADRA
jgi:hypothetical protein